MFGDLGLALCKIGGAPEIPARYGAIWFPLYAGFYQIFGRGELALAIERSEAGANAIVVHWPNVWATQAGDEQHFHGPAADAAHLREPLDQFLIVHAMCFGQGRNSAVDSLAREIANRQQLVGGEPGRTQLRIR